MRTTKEYNKLFVTIFDNYGENKLIHMDFFSYLTKNLYLFQPYKLHLHLQYMVKYNDNIINNMYNNGNEDNQNLIRFESIRRKKADAYSVMESFFLVWFHIDTVNMNAYDRIEFNLNLTFVDVERFKKMFQKCRNEILSETDYTGQVIKRVIKNAFKLAMVSVEKNERDRYEPQPDGLLLMKLESQNKLFSNEIETIISNIINICIS